MTRHIIIALSFYVLLALLMIYGDFSPADLPHPADRQYITALLLSAMPGVYFIFMAVRQISFSAWIRKNTLIRASEEYTGLNFIYIEDERPDDGQKVIMGWVSINNDVSTKDGYILDEEWFNAEGVRCTTPPDVWIPMPYPYKD